MNCLISQGCSDGDDWNLKQFMWEQGIPFWTDIHHRICGLFTTAGAVVYYVECMDNHGRIRRRLIRVAASHPKRRWRRAAS